MRIFIYVLALTIISCNDQQKKTSKSGNLPTPQPSVTSESQNQNKRETCWTGSLNSKTPIFIHCQLDGNVIVGDIIYLNTKGKVPINDNFIVQV